MSRTFTILKHTFREAISQPIYGLLVAVGAVVLVVYGTLPFFTLGEDTVMFKAVALDVILLVVLLASLFAASRSIFEEIEDRTMLTLMSKPVSRAEVLVGKYLGLLASSGLAVLALGTILGIAVYLRVPGDEGLPPVPLDDDLAEQLWSIRYMHLAGLVPQLLLSWMQIGVLIAISVAISTRFSLVVNLPATLLLYVAGNLTQFVEYAAAGEGSIARAGAYAVNTILPFLSVFDAKDLTVYSPIAVTDSLSADPNAVTQVGIWLVVAAGAVYFLGYATFVLGVGVVSLQRRDLGGNDG